jgi:hypothetical protein
MGAEIWPRLRCFCPHVSANSLPFPGRPSSQCLILHFAFLIFILPHPPRRAKCSIGSIGSIGSIKISFQKMPFGGVRFHRILTFPGIPPCHGLRRQSPATTALSHETGVFICRMAAARKSGVALRFPPQSKTRMVRGGLLAGVTILDCVGRTGLSRRGKAKTEASTARPMPALGKARGIEVPGKSQGLKARSALLAARRRKRSPG